MWQIISIWQRKVFLVISQLPKWKDLPLRLDLGR
jgi:hypothetical protein